jgi:hypothetical protein
VVKLYVAAQDEPSGVTSPLRSSNFEDISGKPRVLGGRIAVDARTQALIADALKCVNRLAVQLSRIDAQCPAVLDGASNETELRETIASPRGGVAGIASGRGNTS